MLRQFLTQRWNHLRWAVYSLMGIGGLGSIIGFMERSAVAFWIGAILLFIGYLAYQIHRHGWGGLGRPIIGLLALVTIYNFWMGQWAAGIRTAILLLIGWGILSIFNRGTRIRGIVIVAVGIILWVYGGYVTSPQSTIGGFFRNFRGTLAGIPTPTIPGIPPVSTPPVNIPPVPPNIPTEVSRILEQIQDSNANIREAVGRTQQSAERTQQSVTQAQQTAQETLREVKKLREEREETSEDGPNVRHNKKYAKKWID